MEDSGIALYCYPKRLDAKAKATHSVQPVLPRPLEFSVAPGRFTKRVFPGFAKKPDCGVLVEIPSLPRPPGRGAAGASPDALLEYYSVFEQLDFARTRLF